MATLLTAGTATSGAALSADTSGSLQIQTGSSPTTAVYINGSQQVGIGGALSSGTQQFEISSANESISRLTSTGASGRQYELISTGGSTGLNAGSLYFYDRTATLPRASINSTGNFLVNNSLLVGTSSSGGQLSVQGNASVAQDIRTTTTSDVIFVVANTSGSASTGLYVMPIRTGSTATFQGGIQFTGSVINYNVTSDYRLKEDVAPMVNALDSILKLKPVTYIWKSNGKSDNGFIAHEIQEIIPNAVSGEKDAKFEDGSINPQCVDYSKVVATLTAAIQELNAKVTALEAQLGVK
jgi:hypothetical protein